MLKMVWEPFTGVVPISHYHQSNTKWQHYKSLQIPSVFEGNSGWIPIVLNYQGCLVLLPYLYKCVEMIMGRHTRPYILQRIWSNTKYHTKRQYYPSLNYGLARLQKSIPIPKTSVMDNFDPWIQLAGCL